MSFDGPHEEALAAGHIHMQRCSDCGTVVFPAGPCCPSCLSTALEWEEMSGCGTLAAYVIYHHAFHPDFADQLPYPVALVRLAEGPHMIAGLSGIEIPKLRNDMALSAVFELQPDGSKLLKFAPKDLA